MLTDDCQIGWVAVAQLFDLLVELLGDLPGLLKARNTLNGILSCVGKRLGQELQSVGNRSKHASDSHDVGDVHVLPSFLQN